MEALKKPLVWICAALLVVVAGVCARRGETVHTAAATVETVSKAGVGDADDPAVWVHPADPARGVIIGTDKERGLSVYNLDGVEIQHLPGGRMNNVDVRYGFPLDGRAADIAVAGNRSNDSLAVYAINPEDGTLRDAAARLLRAGIVVYGSCLYRNPEDGKYYVFVNSQAGEVEQWELFANGSGLIDARRVREFQVGSQTEGCVADDELGVLYIGEEARAIWKYGAKPEDGDTREMVDMAGGHFVPDVEGLAIYHGPNGTGYLIASSQGNNTYVVYERGGSNEYVMTFRIGPAGAIDGAEETDGIDVINLPLGDRFPNGLFVVQDGRNLEGTSTNFKLVPWESIARAADPPLMIEPGWNPRTAIAGETGN